MKIIAHRGNLNGSSPQENHPDQIIKVLKLKLDAEIDVWHLNNKLYLGHDEPKYEINLSWLELYKTFLWVHIKNIEAFNIFKSTDFNYFWHETDKFTLTSKGIPWCYFDTYIESGITVMKDKNKPKKIIYGICTDYPLLFDKH